MTAEPPGAHPTALRTPAQRVSPRARTMWRAEAAVGAVVTLVVLLALRLVWDGLPWWAIAMVVVVDLVWVAVVPEWRYRVHRWETTGTAVHTRRGWWSVEHRIAPMSRVQTVDLAEGAVARLFGLATVTVTTASAAGALAIEGLDRDTARRLVEELTRRADAVEGDAT